MLRRVLPVAVALLSGSGCSSTSSSAPPRVSVEDAGASDADAAGASDEDAALPPPVAFTPAEVQELFDLKCVRCHTDIDVLDLRDYAPATIGVSPSSSDVRAKCADGAAKMIIAPGDRDASLLWHKVTSTQDCGDPMPPPFRGTKLTDRELESLGLYIDGL